jgi:hypothetical protein
VVVAAEHLQQQPQTQAVLEVVVLTAQLLAALEIRQALHHLRVTMAALPPVVAIPALVEAVQVQ